MPGSDNWADAPLLTGSAGTVTGSNVGATMETGEPSPYAGTGTKSVWWKWVAPSSGTFSIRTFGSNFDTVLDVFTGATLAGLTRIVGNDDFPGISPRSQVSFTATAGTTYYIRVMGFNAAQGNITLSWVSGTTFPAAPTLVQPSPAHGLPGATVALTGTGFSGVTSVQFGTFDASFTINSSTSITATIPAATAAATGVTVIVPGGGSATRSFDIYFPGPWIQPADAVGDAHAFGGNATVETDFAYGSSGLPDYPDATAPLIDPEFATPFWEIVLVNTGGGDPDHWRWKNSVGILAVDVAATIATDDGTVLAPWTPSSGDISAAGAVSFQLEGEIGTPTGPLHLTTNAISAGTEHNYSDGLYDPPDPGVHEAASLQVYQLPSSWYDWVLTGGILRPTLDRWYTGPEIGALPLVAAIAASDGVLHPLSGLPATQWYSTSDEDYALDVTLTEDDLDDGQYGLLFAFDLLVDETQPALPTPGGTPVYDRLTGSVISSSLTLGITYRPPRFRYLFLEPQATATGWTVGAIAMT